MLSNTFVAICLASVLFGASQAALAQSGPSENKGKHFFPWECSILNKRLPNFVWRSPRAMLGLRNADRLSSRHQLSHWKLHQTRLPQGSQLRNRNVREWFLSVHTNVDLKWYFFRCGVVSFEGEGYELRSDLSKPYPDCCPTPAKIQ